MTVAPGSELRRLRALIADLDAVVWEADETGRFTFVSDGVYDLLGYTPKQWLSDPHFWADHIHPEDREAAVKELRRADATGEPFSSEYRMIATDGRVVWFHDEASVVRDETGHAGFWHGVMFDITERKRAEEQLEEAEARYRALIEQTPVVTYLDRPDTSDVSVYISPQVEQMLGYTPEEMTREVPLWPALIHPEDRERVLGESSRGDDTGEPYNSEYRLIARDERVVWVHDQAVLVRDEAGNPKFWQGVLVDVSARKRAAELERALEVEREAASELRALDEMKTTFLQAVSHDLRTPLAAILGLAVTLQRSDVEFDAAEARDLAGRIATNARRLDRMVNDLLDLDRIGCGMVAPALAPTDIGALVRKLVGESDLVAGRRVEVDADPLIADVDAPKVERIVENLLANTARHTPSKACVWVKVKPHDGGVLIAVEDEGPGVSEEYRAEIFEPFRQGPDVPEHSPGVGIGLALVASFAEMHGGHAWVEERKGGGASFRVFLPSTPPEEEPAR